MAKVSQRTRIYQLFVDHSDRLQRYIGARLHNDDDARDIAQEAYLRLLRIDRFDLLKHPQAYLFRIAKNLIYEIYAGKRLTVEDDVDLDSLEIDDPTPEEVMAHKTRLRHIKQAMSDLSPKCQAVTLLYWRDGLTQEEIGAELNLSRSMVQKYLATGLAHCRKKLRRQIEADRCEG